mgnify:CR=1 FL=1
MNNIIKRVWNQNRLVNIEDLTGMVFQAEADGHTFEISGVDDTGAAVELSGTVSGVFRRPDNADIALTGSASDGVVSVTLDENCYAVTGRFALTIFVTSGSQTVAVYAAVGTVAATSGGNVAGDTPESVADLIADIEAAVATIPPTYTDLMASIAPIYSSSALYGVGSYSWYDGALYRCTTPITTAETWNSAHWTAAVLGDDVSDLKSALDDKYDRYKEVDIKGLSSDMFDVYPSQYSIVTYDETDAIQHSSLAGSGITNLISAMKHEYDDFTFKFHYGYGATATTNPIVRLTLAQNNSIGAIAFGVNLASGNVSLATSSTLTLQSGIARNENCRLITADDKLHYVRQGTKVALYLVDNGSEIPIFADEFVDIVAKYGSLGFTESDLKFGLCTNNSARNEPLIYDFIYVQISGDHFMAFDEVDARLTALENGQVASGVVDLFLFMGQSNMAGRGTSAQAPAVIAGAGYEFRPVSDPTKLYPIEEPFGVAENDSDGINDVLGGYNAKTGDMIPAFVNAYFTETRCPIVGVSASEGGTRISSWQSGQSRYTDALGRWNDAINFLAENDYSIRHKYVVWCQGESDGDASMSKADYATALTTLAETWLTNGAEAFFVIKIGNYNGESAYDYSDVMNAQTEVCQTVQNVVMASTDFAGMKARDLMKDDWHYKQAAYNEVGKYAGVNIAFFVKTGKEPTMYDTQDGSLYFTHKN